MKHKTLLVYVPCLEGGCEDVGRIDLAGHTLVSDERLWDLEAAEKERDEFKRACFGHISDNALLRAKIAEMEQQEPVGEIQRANSTGNYICSEVWVPLPVGSKLYALPGAKGE